MHQAARKRVIIITGASRGLGRAIALRFGRAGERIVINFLRNEGNAATIADEIHRAGGEALPIKADVRDAEAVEGMIGETVKRWGPVDVTVNNAGLTRDGLLLRMPEKDWDDVLDTNLTGPFHTMRAVSKIMMKQRNGHIINIASIAGLQGREGQANYSASKAGLVGLTMAAARELGRHDIKVNAILPGYIKSDMGAGVSDTVRERLLRENVLGRTNEPEEVAEFIFRLSLMKNVSGQVFNLDSRIR